MGGMIKCKIHEEYKDRWKLSVLIYYFSLYRCFILLVLAVWIHANVEATSQQTPEIHTILCY